MIVFLMGLYDCISNLKISQDERVFTFLFVHGGCRQTCIHSNSVKETHRMCFGNNLKIPGRNFRFIKNYASIVEVSRNVDYSII